MGFFKKTKEKIGKTARAIVGRKFKKAIYRIEERIKDKNLEIWMRTSTYYSLTTQFPGSLYHQFGFPDGEGKMMVDDVLGRIAESVDVSWREFSVKRAVLGQVQIAVLKVDLDNILSSPFASHMTKKGFSIDWAKWLLTKGNAIIIAKYDFREGYKDRSRSGDGIMVRSKTPWRVPPEYSGTPTHNWLTKAMQQALEEIEEEYKIIIIQEIERVN